MASVEASVEKKVGKESISLEAKEEIALLQQTKADKEGLIRVENMVEKQSEKIDRIYDFLLAHRNATEGLKLRK